MLAINPGSYRPAHCATNLSSCKCNLLVGTVKSRVWRAYTLTAHNCRCFHQDRSRNRRYKHLFFSFSRTLTASPKLWFLFLALNCSSRAVAWAMCSASAAVAGAASWLPRDRKPAVLLVAVAPSPRLSGTCRFILSLQPVPKGSQLDHRTDKNRQEKEKTMPFGIGHGKALG